MPFDDFDEKIKSIVEQERSLDFDKVAWKKMSRLLDKKLPQQKKPNWLMGVWILGLLLSVGGAYLLLQKKPNKPESTEAGGVKKTNQLTPKANTTAIDFTETTVSTPAAKTDKIVSEKVPENSILKPTSTIHLSKVLVNQEEKREKQNSSIITSANSAIQKEAAPVIDNNNKAEEESFTPINNKQTPAYTAQHNQLTDALTISTNNSLTPKETDTVATKEENKNYVNPNGGVGISLLTGMDYSTTGKNSGGIRPSVGIAISFDISKYWTLRAGFIIGRKVYTADSTTYKTARRTINTDYKLQEINANCLVYEIPVSVQYNFGFAKNHNWYAAAGLSTYLMKQEDYMLIYKDSNAETDIHNYSYKNRNKHWFSVLDLSAGYQYRLSKNLSLAAEPYFRIPLSGVGMGNIKLKSAGLQLAVKYNPFSFKK